MAFMYEEFLPKKMNLQKLDAEDGLLSLLNNTNEKYLFLDTEVVGSVKTLDTVSYTHLYSLLRTIQLAGVEFLIVSVSTPDQCVHFIRGKIGELALDKSCRLFLGNAVAIVHTSQAMQVVAVS